MTLVFVAIPSYEGRIYESLQQTFGAASQEVPLRRAVAASSFTTWNFNRLLCDAVNDLEATHALFWHEDVLPQGAGWLPWLLAELDHLQAAALSAVIPIKSPEGLTSTALLEDGSWSPRRLTIRELGQLPVSFDGGDVARLFGVDPARHSLVVNTGLVLLDLRGDLRDQWARFPFHCEDRIVRVGERWEAESLSEDWNWSRAVVGAGLPVYATRGVPLIHLGLHPFCNCCVWGDLEHDLPKETP